MASYKYAFLEDNVVTWVTFSHTLGGEENPLILVASLGEEAPCISLGRHSEI